MLQQKENILKKALAKASEGPKCRNPIVITEGHGGEAGLVSTEADSGIRARYPLEYLKKIIKAAKLPENVMPEFGTDYPMRLGFRDVDKVSLRFILAPRVED